MSLPPPPFPPAAAHTALHDAALAIATAAGNVDAVIASLGPPPSGFSQAKLIGRYLVSKMYEGMCLGVVFLMVALVDRSGNFVDTVSSGLTSMPVTVALTGILGGYVYVISLSKSGFIARAGAAWLDLVQQFFTLAVGAFWPVKLGLYARIELYPKVGDTLDAAADLATFAWLCAMALLVGGFWTLKDHPVSPAARKVAGLTVVIAVVLLLGLLATATGGEDLKDGIPQMLRKVLVNV